MPSFPSLTPNEWVVFSLSVLSFLFYSSVWLDRLSVVLLLIRFHYAKEFSLIRPWNTILFFILLWGWSGPYPLFTFIIQCILSWLYRSPISILKLMIALFPSRKAKLRIAFIPQGTDIDHVKAVEVLNAKEGGGKGEGSSSVAFSGGVNDAVEVTVCTRPFSKGAMREAFYVTMDPNIVSSLFPSDAVTCVDPSIRSLFVLKRYIAGIPTQVGKTVLKMSKYDMIMQHVTYLLANEFTKKLNETTTNANATTAAATTTTDTNKKPQGITFVPTCLVWVSPPTYGLGLYRGDHIEVDPNGYELYSLEPVLVGPYKKFSNNAGYVTGDKVSSGGDPTAFYLSQSFSHFTLHRSDKRLCVVDMQGVFPYFTDPQIHTSPSFLRSFISFFGFGDATTQKYGIGNLQKYGIDSFIQTHKCNPICQMLKLKRF